MLGIGDKIQQGSAGSRVFSVDVIQTLNLYGKAFIMPAIKGPGIKKAIMEHVEEKRPAVSKYTMTSRKDTPRHSRW